MEYMLKEIGIDLPGEYGKNGSYIIDLDSDNEWGKIYTLLDNAENVEQDEESFLLTTHNSSLIYTYNNLYRLVLKADFDQNLYSLICSQIR